MTILIDHRSSSIVYVFLCALILTISQLELASWALDGGGLHIPPARARGQSGTWTPVTSKKNTVRCAFPTFEIFK